MLDSIRNSFRLQRDEESSFLAGVGAIPREGGDWTSQDAAGGSHLTKEPGTTHRIDTDARPDRPACYGDLIELNTARCILDSVGEDLLNSIVDDYLDLLGSSSAVYERNGDYAFGLNSSGWCRFLDESSRRLCDTDDNREALSCGKWHCHESCWKASRTSMETGQSADVECNGGIRIYAVPILADDEVIGSINFGYGSPPTDARRLRELAERYQVDIEDLFQHAMAHSRRPSWLVEVAKARLQTAAKLIGAVVGNIKQREQLQLQLAHAQRLEAIGQLAAGIAHEINTPIQYVSDNTRFLQKSFMELVAYLQAGLFDENGQLRSESAGAAPSPVDHEDLEYVLDEIPQAIEESLEGLQRVAEIIHAVKGFALTGNVERIPTDVNDVIRNAITVASDALRFVAEVSTDLDPDLPSVPCVPGDLSQIVLHLIVNAAHAVSDAVGDGSRGKGAISILTRYDDDGATIRIEDTGVGIPDAIRERIFEPSFTTREVGEGTGQGLAIVRSLVVDKHGGSITFDTTPGEGTTFLLRLPLEARALVEVA